ncbi:MAG: ATP-dependent Clp protease ATP-binding subunit, partial [Butyrivibrio sp.]|nr:ATP-dependent Clp protease ATP-binding subunit [Butyrivibrio sp.]
TDSQGRTVDFKNTILIMTSNVGAQRIMEPKKLGFGAVSDEKKDYESMKESVMEEVKRLFKPEFINRIDEIMVFHPLNNREMNDIVTLLARTLAARCKKQLELDLTMTASAKKYLVEKYADPKMGARPLKRAMQSAVEDALAEELLRGQIKRGEKVTITMKDDKLIFKGSSSEENTGKKKQTSRRRATAQTTTNRKE